MQRWVDVAIEEGVRFFITSLGKPRWVVDRVAQGGGLVYHDVTERKWALKGLDSGVRGLIAVNQRAGGHAGPKSAEQLVNELGDLGVPLVCAGGIGDAAGFVAALRMGYAGAQLGTRFIATTECTAHPDYKRAIVDAEEDDIVLTERVTGVPLAVIRTPYVERVGTKAGPIARWLLRHRRAVEKACQGAKIERLRAHEQPRAVWLGAIAIDRRCSRGEARDPEAAVSHRGHRPGVRHDHGLNGMSGAGDRIDRECGVVHAVLRGEVHNQAVARIRRHEDQLVQSRREKGPALPTEDECAAARPVHRHGQGGSTANRVQHVETRGLRQRRAVAAVARGQRREHQDQARLHCSRSTTYTLRCAVGTMIRSRMFTWSGRFTTYAIASATSSADSGLNPWYTAAARSRSPWKRTSQHCVPTNPGSTADTRTGVPATSRFLPSVRP